MNPLSSTFLAAATQALVQKADFSQKLEWWLISPHAAERWLQFEFAFALNQIYQGQYLVACEIDRADFAIYDSTQITSPIWRHPATAKMEFKFYGNWYLQPGQRDQLAEDFRKVNELSIPAVALLAYIEVSGSATGSPYDWCFDQIPKLGVTTFDNAVALLDHESRLVQIVECKIPASQLAGFSTMAFRLLGYRNALACDQ